MPEASLKKRVLTGFLTNATNPKGIIFMVAVLPQFMTTSRPLAPQLAILAVTMLAVDTTVMHSYAAGASALRGLMRSARHAQPEPGVRRPADGRRHRPVFCSALQ